MRHWLYGFVVLFVVSTFPCYQADAIPRRLRRTLKKWVKAVKSEKHANILALIPTKSKIRWRTSFYKKRVDKILSKKEIAALLKAGKDNHLGLAKLLLLPRAKDSKKIRKGRYSIRDKRCPEVVWVFAKRGKRWFLVELKRFFYSC